MVDRIEACFDALGYGLWALEVTSTGQFIGFTGLNPMPDDVPGAGGVEVGWRLARPAWHHGYATEAARAALRVAFDGVGLDEIWSMTAVLNEPSQAVMRRIGLTEVARFDHPRVPEGSPVRPHVTYHRRAPGRPARSLQALLEHAEDASHHFLLQLLALLGLQEGGHRRDPAREGARGLLMLGGRLLALRGGLPVRSSLTWCLSSISPGLGRCGQPGGQDLPCALVVHPGA